MALVHNLDKIPNSLREKARDFSAPLKLFYVYMLQQTAKTFNALGKKGAGNFRGVSWPWFAPIKSGGKYVPAEGNRVRHSFATTPWVTKTGEKRKRPSKHCVQAGSRLLQDTGILRNAAMGRFTVSPFQLVADTPVKYANWQQERRPFVFIAENDTQKLAKMINEYLLGAPQ